MKERYVKKIIKKSEIETVKVNTNAKRTIHNLKKKKQDKINFQIQNQISSLCVHKGYVIQKLLQIAEFSLTEEDILDKEGCITGKRKLRDTSAGLKALENLCKYLGFNEPETEDYKPAKIITISNLDDEKI